MKRFFATLLVFGAMTLFSTTVSAQLNQFFGSFKNTNAATGGITRLDITRGGAQVKVQVWGKCSPSDCDWGVQDAFAYGDKPNSDLANSAREISAIYRTNFSQTILMIRPLGANRLQVESFTRFTDNTSRTAYSNRENFTKDNSTASVDEDCITYNPTSLAIRNEGASGWLLTDGRSRMLVLDNRADAEKALALAQRHTSHCFIGRQNRRSDRKSYIVDYWKGDSGISTTIPNEDCISYNPNNLTMRNEGANGWLLSDGSSRMLMLDNRSDATLAKQIAENNTRQCFVGRGNTRPDRKNYIFNYWR